MWKLFISVLAMSDTGSVATTAIVTDYPTQQSCMIARNDFNAAPINRVLNGHKVTIQANALCKPVEGEPQVAEGYGPPPGDYDPTGPIPGYDPRVRSSRPGYVPMPPPIQGIINGFLQGFGGRY